MSMKRLILILIFLKLYFNRIQSKETTCLINGKKSLNVVNDRFLSFSIDPATLLIGFNLSSISMKMAEHLSPSFIRIDGPSTNFINFSEDEKDIAFLEETNNFTVTPMMWKSLNYWIENANLTPVFAISDQNRTNGVWNPSSILPLLNMSGKMNFSCYWQLGHDCKDKSIIQYKHDLSTLKQALDEHSSSRKYWKIVGSDLQRCLSKQNPELARKTLEFLDDVTDAVIWQEQIEKNPRQFSSTPVPVWLVVPKLSQPTTFSSGLLWAKQIGDAAKAGYEVIFRQPTLQELSVDTPVYWVSLIYKRLMGRNVLQIRSNSLPEPNINIYAHCTKNQNNYSKQGAMTIFVVNNGTTQHTTSLRVAISYPGSIEVQSYIITSDGENSLNTYLNGAKLTLQARSFQLFPAIQKVRFNKLLKLVSPPKSVAFFVLPAAKVPVCIKNEDETHFFMQNNHEINSNDYYGQSDEDLKPQIPEEYRKVINVHDSQHLTGQELNETPLQKTLHKNFNELKKQTPSFSRQESKDKLRNQHTMKEFRQYLARQRKLPKGDAGMTAKVEIIFTERPVKNQTLPSHIKTVELELTNDEIKKILKDRAKSKVAESNIDMTSAELENVLKEAAEKVDQNEQTDMETSKRKRFAVSNILRKVNTKAKKMIQNQQRLKRDINMELLDLKTPTKKSHKSLVINNQDIQATIRKAGQTSEELLKDIENSSEEGRDVFAELASSLEKYAGSSEFENDGAFVPHFGSKNPPKPTQKGPKEALCPGASYLDERVRFLMEPSGIDTFVEEDLKNYHNFQENYRFQKMVNPSPKFNNEIRNLDRFSQENAANLEIGEWNNYGKSSPVVVGPSINKEVWDVHPILAEKDQVEEINSFPRKHNDQNDNVAPSVVIAPRFNNKEFQQGNNGKIKEVFSEGEQSVTNPAAWKKNSEQSKIPLYTVRPQLNRVMEKWGEGSVTNSEKDETLSLVNAAVLPANQVVPEINPLHTRNVTKDESYASIVVAPPRFDWQETYSGKSNTPFLPYTVLPQFNKKMQKLDQVSIKNNEKQENPAPSKLAAPLVSRELWEGNSFSQGNIQQYVKSQTNKEVWDMDIFSQNSKDNKADISSSEYTTTLANMQWEINEAFPKNAEEVANPSVWKTITPFSTEKTQINKEAENWDTWTNDESVYKFTAELKPRIKKQAEEVENDSVKFKKPYSNDTSRTWNTNHTNTLIEGVNVKIEGPTPHQSDSEMNEINKMAPHASETGLSKLVGVTVEKTLQNLENYFCDPKNARFKRADPEITNDDIKNYRKFMMEQLRVMKNSKNSKLQDEGVPRPPSKNVISKPKTKLPAIDSKSDKLSSDGEHLHIVFGKPYDPEKLHINERRRAVQVQKLKQRLQNRKKMNEKMKERRMQHTEVNDNGLVSSRRKRTPYNVHTNEVSNPKSRKWNGIERYYQRKIFRPQPWKPQDIFKLKRVPSYSVEVVDNREFLQRTAPFTSNKFMKNKIHKRSAGDGIDLSENTIEDYPSIENKIISKFLTNAKEEHSYGQLMPANINQGWVGTTTEETNDIYPSKWIKTAVTFESSTTNVDGVTFGKTDSLHDVSRDQTQKPTAESVVQPHFMDMIMDAVNTTISSFVHLGEQISKQLNF